ncbi:MAG TPA: HAMP domain-containing sensor histidine kinase [Clostridia bacterium]
MRFKTLWLRLFLHFGLVLVLFGVLVTLAQQIFLTTIQLNRTKELLSNTAKVIVSQINTKHISPYDIEGKKNEDLLSILDEQSAINNVQIIIYKGDTIFYPLDNIGEITSITTKASDSDSYGTFYEKVGEDKRRGISYLVYVRNIYQDYTGYKLELRTHLTTIQQSVDLTNYFTRIVSIAAIFLSLIWAFLFSRIFTKPIVSMNKLTYELANLNFDHKLEIDRSDELGQLAENINSMSDKLKASMYELKIKNEQLTKELEREKGLETMRKKFVSDVSHELKTPLSIIQGYAEALKASVSKSAEKREYYCDVIMDETAKMTKLVHDLLNLSQYTSGTFSIEPSLFKIDELVCSVADRYSTLIGQKEINLQTHLEPCEIYADPLRIEQVINNYLNNAISHTDENRQLVIIGKVLDSEFYRVSVFNSGKPISNEDLEKVWIPFYKADKARSRSEGRYGIGLSIVKAIMEAHKGRYGVNNVPNGVEFYCDIPIKKK